MKTNIKSIIIAGAIAVGLYFLLHRKKIMLMTHPLQWQDMTPEQRAAYIRRTTLTTMAEKIKALKEVRKQKSADENTPLTETKLTPEEQEAVLQALEAEKEQGTGFDYIRERNPLTPAVPVEKKTHTSSPSTKQKTIDERTAWTEKHLSPYKYVDVEENFPRKDNSSNYSQIPEEEIGVSKKINDKKKADDKKKAEEKKKANEAWDKIVNDVRGPFLKPIYTVSPSKTKKKTTYNKSKIIKALAKKNKI